MLTWADFALLLILAVSMGIGLWRGFVVEVLSLTVWIAAFWLSMGFGEDVAQKLVGVEQASARLFLGYAGVFIAVLLAGGLLTWLIGKVIANTGLSGTDRVLGLGFGLLRGLVLACVAVLLMGFTPLPQDAWWQQSRLLPSVQRGAEWMAEFLPAAAAEEIEFGAPPLAPEPVDPGAPPEAAAVPVPEN
ncbi:MAG: CvpA family protein [Arenimonas sp.]|uniref:CvpA family protein n=1 Tax=Arenimonas sp. TaxID=1872635 RepID=UPI0025BA8171|nr:CvpA family protein [Arenimonas sp.]MBW8366611.1 CvpA family protein [Arenimonas sp.]